MNFLSYPIWRKTQIFRLVYSLFAFFILSDTIAQTACVAIKTNSEIIIAADSKFGFDIACKIRPVLNYFYTMAGYAELKKFGFSAPQIIDTTFKTNRTFVENIYSSVQNIKRAYPSAIRKIMQTRDSTEFNEKFRKERGVILNIIFAGKDSSGLIMYKKDFQVIWENNISFAILAEECGNGCNFVTYPIGRYIEMRAYIKNHRIDSKADFITYAKRLIEEAITYNPKTVGAPIDILQIPRVGNPRWVQRKPQCHD